MLFHFGIFLLYPVAENQTCKIPDRSMFILFLFEVCLPGSVLTFHNYGVQGKSLLDGRVSSYILLSFITSFCKFAEPIFLEIRLTSLIQWRAINALRTMIIFTF